jgi:hypothetical protein
MHIPPSLKLSVSNPRTSPEDIIIPDITTKGLNVVLEHPSPWTLPSKHHPANLTWEGQCNSFRRFKYVPTEACVSRNSILK